MQSNFVKFTDSDEEINDFLLRKQYCYASLSSKIKPLLTHMKIPILTSISHRPLKRLHNTVHVFDSKSSKFYSFVYNRGEDILPKLNRKHIFNLPCVYLSVTIKLQAHFGAENCTNDARKT